MGARVNLSLIWGRTDDKEGNLADRRWKNYKLNIDNKSQASVKSQDFSGQVKVKSHMSLCESSMWHVTYWWPARGVPSLSPKDRQDRLQLWAGMISCKGPRWCKCEEVSNWRLHCFMIVLCRANCLPHLLWDLCTVSFIAMTISLSEFLQTSIF